jgi:hypothetical protein
MTTNPTLPPQGPPIDLPPPVRYRALLAEDQRAQELRSDRHDVSFKDERTAESWISSEKTFNGWLYTLEPLFSAEQLRGAVEADRSRARCAQAAEPSAPRDALGEREASRSDIHASRDGLAAQSAPAESGENHGE